MPEPTLIGEFYVDEGGTDEYTTEDGTESYTVESSEIIGGILYRLHRALANSLSNLRTAAKQIEWDMMPDNPDFTIQDAHDWYRRLGIYDSGLVSFSDMKAAIYQRMSWPLVPLDKQNYLFIQAQLQAAGFNVYVYENRFFIGGQWITQTPGEVLGIDVGDANYGDFGYGELGYGDSLSNSGVTKIVDYLEEIKDEAFVVSPNYRSTFFIAGSTISTFANVPAARKIEFRQLIMKLKQEQSCGFLFINYV